MRSKNSIRYFALNCASSPSRKLLYSKPSTVIFSRVPSPIDLPLIKWSFCLSEIFLGSASGSLEGSPLTLACFHACLSLSIIDAINYIKQAVRGAEVARGRRADKPPQAQALQLEFKYSKWHTGKYVKIFTYRYIWLWSMPSSKLFKWHTVRRKSEVDEEIRLSDKSLLIRLIMQVIYHWAFAAAPALCPMPPPLSKVGGHRGTCPSWIYGAGASVQTSRDQDSSLENSQVCLGLLQWSQQLTCRNSSRPITTQRRRQENSSGRGASFSLGRVTLPPPSPSLPSPVPPLSLSSLPLPYLSLPFPSPLVPSPPLRSRPPKIQLGSLGSAVSSPSGVWGGAPADKRFGAF